LQTLGGFLNICVKEERDQQSDQNTKSYFAVVLENGEYNIKYYFKNETEELAVMSYIQLKLKTLMEQKRIQIG
jgi:hypothetical protein